MSTPERHSDTLLQHLGEEQKVGRAVTQPIFQTSLFVYDTMEQLQGLLQDPSYPDGPHAYSRVSNPNTRTLEKKIAMLERTEDARVFGSGMGAISAAILNSIQSGSHVVAVDTIYGPSKGFIESYLTRFGVTVTYVDGLTPESVLDAIRPETALIYLESPSSLVFRLQDIRAIAEGAKAKGVRTLIDNTCATSIYQQPATMGVDFVVHSASKYLGGHSDLVAGVLCGSQSDLENVFMNEVQYLGAILPPFPAWLMTRGVRTLKLRIKRHEETANQVATWLSARADVARVNHVSLPSYPQADLYRRQMGGSGGLFSFELKNQSREFTSAFVNALGVYQIGVSWGGFESLVVPSLIQPFGYDEPTWVIRLFCGLEDPGDLIADLDQALSAAARTGS